MTIIEAITRADDLFPNGYTQHDKVGWLSMVDGMIKSHIIDSHEGGDLVPFSGYDDDTPLSTVLLVPSPYEELYISWIESKIHYTNTEYVKYNNAVTRFNDVFKAYQNDYNRRHMPLGEKAVYF